MSDEEMEFLMSILPKKSPKRIKKVLAASPDLGSAVQTLLKGSPKTKRTVVNINLKCPRVALDGARNATKSVRSLDIITSENSPDCTISISFHGNPCKPLIYVEPEDLDSQFCSNIESNSIILSEYHSSPDLLAACSLYDIVLLPLKLEYVTNAVKHVLSTNSIIGDGANLRQKGDVWVDILGTIPLIKGTYAKYISESIKHPYEVSEADTKNLKTTKGNKIPDRVIKSLKTFYLSDDPNVRLELSTVRKKNKAAIE